MLREESDEKYAVSTKTAMYDNKSRDNNERERILKRELNTRRGLERKKVELQPKGRLGFQLIPF